MKNFDFDFKPKEYFQENGYQIYDLYNEDEEELITIAVIEFGCALPFSSFVFMNAYLRDGKYEYKLVDEDQIHSYKIKHSFSDKPLTMGQVIENIDSAILMEDGSVSYDEMPVGIIHSFLSKGYKPGTDIEEEMKGIKVDSNFYPLNEYYEEQKKLWLEHLYKDGKDFVTKRYQKAKNILLDDFEERIKRATPDICENFMIISEDEKLLKQTIDKGESKKIEFKESLSLDVRQTENNSSYKPKKENYIELSVLKTIAGFLNSDGGELFIGVNDESKVFGIDTELKIFHKSSKDKMQLHLKTIIKENIGLSSSNFINSELKKVSGKEIIHITCRKSDEAVYIKDKDFYIRSGPSTDKLEGRELVKYTRSRFKS